MCFDREGVKPAEEYLKQAVSALAGGDYSHPLFRFVQAVVKSELATTLQSVATAIWDDYIEGVPEHSGLTGHGETNLGEDDDDTSGGVLAPKPIVPMTPQAVGARLMDGDLELDEVRAVYD